MKRSLSPAKPRPDVVLTKAVLHAAERLAISQAVLAEIIGASAASISRLNKSRHIDPNSKEGELALLFLRVFRSLDALLGGHEQQAQAWLKNDNHHLNGVPLTLMRTVAGITRVTAYLDSMRGKI